MTDMNEVARELYALMIEANRREAELHTNLYDRGCRFRFVALEGYGLYELLFSPDEVAALLRGEELKFRADGLETDLTMEWLGKFEDRYDADNNVVFGISIIKSLDNPVELG